MKVTVKESVPQMLERFLGYLTGRAQDPIHDGNRDLIADFVEKFVLVEMKMPETAEKPFDHTVEVPDEVYTKPLELAQKQVDVYKAFLNKVLHAQESIATTAREFLNKGVPKDIPSLDSATAQIHTIDKALAAKDTPAPAPAVTPPVIPPATEDRKARNGNGHASKKVRDLNDNEKDIIRAGFTSLNGQIHEDACKPIHDRLNPEVSMAQVTGFVTYLHGRVASGALTLKDMPAYLTFIEGHRDLWATYNSPKYQALRGKK